jgi:anti-anti-sigma regulatory factor
MRTRQAVQIAILVVLVLVLTAGIVFSVRTSSAITNGFRFLTQDVGIWAPSQQEREILRLRELVGQIALGASVSEQDYTLQRDLAISRINITRDTVRDNPTLFEGDKALYVELEQTLMAYQAIEGGLLPTPDTARRLGPSLNTMASISHQFLNDRRDAENISNLRTIAVIQQLQAVQIGTLALLCAAGGSLFWLTRRALSTDLATAYAEARQRASDLETSQAQLAAANQELEQQNRAARQALAELEASTQARAQLESTVQHLAFPIIPVVEGVLVLPLIGNPNHARLAEAGTRLCDAITRARASVAIIDITGLLAMDSDIARELLRIARTTTLLGCRPMLVGITPAAAKELVQLDFGADDLTTQSTLQQAVALALRMRAPKNPGSFQPHT